MAEPTSTAGPMTLEQQAAVLATQRLTSVQQAIVVALGELGRGKLGRAKVLFDLAGDMTLDVSHELKRLAGEIE